MRRSSRWLPGVLGLSACLALAAPARAADYEKLLPAESEAVISINVRQLLDSSLVKQYALDTIKKAMMDSAEAKQAFAALGLDPLKDFERVTIAGQGEDPQNVKGLVVIQGRFEPKKFNTVLTELAKQKNENISVVKDGERTMFKVTGPDQPTPMYAAVVSDSVLVMGTTKELVRNAFAAAEGMKKPAISKDLSALLEKADPKASLFIVAVTKGKSGGLPIPDPNVKKALEQIQSIYLDLKVTKDVNLDITMNFEDEQAAKLMGAQMAEGLKQAKAVVPLLTIQNPQLKPLGEAAGTLKSMVKGKGVTISGTLAGTIIDKLLQKGE